jgi:sugar phosphate isomerase/epimerase
MAMTSRPARLGIDFLSVLAMPPLEFIALAASLGCQSISLGLAPMSANPHGYPAWSLRTDRPLRRAVIAALRDHDVSVTHGEGVFLSPRQPAASFADDLDILAELGIRQTSIVVLGFDPVPALAEMAALAALATERGLASALEFVPGCSFGDLPSAIEAVDSAGGDIRLVVDLMHVFRSGGTVAELAALPAELVAHIQLCDVPLANPSLSYGEEALHERLAPGEGELPLAAALEVLPATASVGLEIPMRSRAAQGIGAYERLKPAVDAARSLIEGLGTARAAAQS